MLQRRGYRDAITYLALRNDIDASRKAHSIKLPWPRRHGHHQRQRMLSEGGLPWQQPELIQRARADPPMGSCGAYRGAAS